MKKQIAINAVEMMFISAALHMGKDVDVSTLARLKIDSDEPEARTHNAAIRLTEMIIELRAGAQYTPDDFRAIACVSAGEKPETVYATRVFKLNVELFARMLEGNNDLQPSELKTRFGLDAESITHLFKGEHHE